MDVHLWQIVALFVVMLISTTLSGMAGGGAAFVYLPLLIAFGLTPQQAVATSKLSSLGMGVGAAMAFKKRAFRDRKLIAFLAVVAVIISLIVPHILSKFNEDTFQTILGVIILSMVPLALTKKYGQKQEETPTVKKVMGGVLMTGAMLLSGIFSGGLATIFNVILISFFGLSTLQASAVKRMSQLILNTSIVLVLVLTTHYIVYSLAITGMIAGLIGGFIGSHIAIRKGENFARYALVIAMMVAGIGLLVG